MVLSLWHLAYHLLPVTPTEKKWQGVKTNLSKNDVVLLKEVNSRHQTWPLARVLEVHPGADGLVRVVMVLCGVDYWLFVHRLLVDWFYSF